LFILICELLLPSNDVIVPYVQHIIQWNKHNLEIVVPIDFALFLQINTWCLPQVLLFKNLMNHFNELFQTFGDDGFNQIKILVDGIWCNTICWNIHKVTMNFWVEERPKCSHASLRYTKYKSWAQTTFKNSTKEMCVSTYILCENLIIIDKWQRKVVSLYLWVASMSLAIKIFWMS
jgi:hypothetical protein